MLLFGIILSLTALFSVICWFSWGYLNRVRGSENRPKWLDNKIVILGLMGFISGLHSCSVIVVERLTEWPVLVLAAVCITIVILEIIAVNILFRPSWGEQFTDVNDTYHEDFTTGVRPVTNAIAGYEYDQLVASNDIKELFWKMISWQPRFFIYGLPLAAIKAGVSLSLMPFAVLGFGALWVGVMYYKARINHPTERDWVAHAERSAGKLLGVLVALMLLP
jgi:hypothetical protein